MIKIATTVLFVLIVVIAAVAEEGMSPFLRAFSFDRGWNCKFYGGKGRYEVTSKGAVIAFRAEAAALFCNLPNSGVSGLEVWVELLEGEVELRCSFRDAAGKEQRAVWRKLRKGVNQLAFKPGNWPGPVKFSSISFRSASRNAEVCINRMVLCGTAPKLSLLEIDCDTPYPINIENPEEKKTIGLRLRYWGKIPLRAGLELVLKEAAGKHAEKLSRELEFAPGAEMSVPLPPMMKNGIRYGEYFLSDLDASEKNIRGKFRIARMVPAEVTEGRTRGFLFGVCGHPQRYSAEDQKREAAAAALFGAKVLREDAGWGRIQPAPGEWDFSSLDQTVAIFGEQGIELELIYSYTPKWAAAKDFRPLKEDRRKIHNSRPDYGAWREFVRRTAERYRDKIRFFEVWNEPDLLSFANFSAEEYIEMLKIAAEETRKAAPGAIVLTGGYTCMPPFHALNDQKHQEKTLAWAKGSYDVHAFHGHGAFDKYYPQIEQMIGMRKRLGINESWWANETAENSIHTGELGQAVTLWKKLFYSWARGSIGYNWYDLRNDGTDPRNPEHNFGMLTHDFQPKAIYPAYNTIIRNFRDAEFYRETTKFEDIHLFEFSGGEHLQGVFWNENPIRNRLLAFRTDATKAELFDMFDNRKVQKISDKIILIPAGTVPLSILLRDAREFEPLCEFFAPAGRMRLKPGEGGQFQFMVANPFPTPETVRVKPSKLPASEIRLAGGEKRRISFDIPRKMKFTEFEIRAEFPNRKLGGSLTLPVASLFCPAGKLKERPDFMLDKEEQVTVLVPADPAKAHLFWQGTNDLSASVSMAKEGGTLKLRVEVSDDIHYQPYSGTDIWQGDSIQFAFQIPNQEKMWVFGVARSNDGSCMEWNWDMPAGFARQQLQRVAVSRTKTKTIYDAELNLDTIGAGKAEELLFNLLINDNDGEMRESFIELAPGLGGPRRTDHYQLINLK